MKAKSTKALFLRHVVMHKKTIMLLAIFALLRFHMQNYVVAVMLQTHVMIAAVQTTMQKMIIPVNARSHLLPVAVLLMIS